MKTTLIRKSDLQQTIAELKAEIKQLRALLTRAANALDTEPGEYPTIDALVHELRERLK
jgi:alkylation response protein AidB-like acyl-CoA dehydrogenase